VNLNDAFALVAEELNLKVDRLIQYAAEDDLPFRPADPDYVSIYSYPFENDGRFLYAMVRTLKPRLILEVGCNHGGSAAHMAAALHRNAIHGRLITVDISEGATLTNVPQKYLRYVELCTGIDAGQWMKQRENTQFIRGFGDYDFIHEDASHEAHVVHSVYHCLPQLMPNGGVVLSHDSCTGVGETILGGIGAAGFAKPTVLCLDDSPGFSVMKYKGIEVKA
jgi:predicted O-methyltransferase YrrM